MNDEGCRPAWQDLEVSAHNATMAAGCLPLAGGLGSGNSVMRWSIEPRLRRHLRVFLGQVAFLTLLDSPTLLMDHYPPFLFLMLLRTMFALTALVLLIAGLFSNWKKPEIGFDLWDHCLAFVLLALGCSIALRLLG